MEDGAKPSSSKRSTIREVALDAKVSVATVSKVLRKAYGVSDAVRARVEQSIERLSYRPLAAARAMRGRSYTLGVILSDIRNPFFADVLEGIQAGLDGTPYQPLLGLSQSETLVEASVIESMIDRQIDGLIFVAPHLVKLQLDDMAARVPMVVFGHHVPEAEAFDTVNNDDCLGAELAIRHLVEKGRQRISMLSSSRVAYENYEHRAVTGQRELGYQAAMTAAGLSAHARVVRVPQASAEMRKGIEALLSEEGRPDAIFCWSDFVALEVIGVARELGLSIPQDLMVVGYDNSAACALPQNNLTSINQFGRTLGEQCVRLLLQRIEGQQRPFHYLISPELVPRQSSAN
jgi:DNA-binding LacI/PurR family transcriptional regulator